MIELRWKLKDMNFPELGDVKVCVQRAEIKGRRANYHYAVLQYRGSTHTEGIQAEWQDVLLEDKS